MLLPYCIYEIKDGNKILIAQVANKILAEDLIEYLAIVYESSFEIER